MKKTNSFVGVIISQTFACWKIKTGITEWILDPNFRTAPGNQFKAIQNKLKLKFGGIGQVDCRFGLVSVWHTSDESEDSK